MEDVKIDLSASRPMYSKDEWRQENFKLAHDEYMCILKKLQLRQSELGITDKYVSSCLCMSEHNYRRLLEGKYTFTALRLVHLCMILDLEMCFLKEDLDFQDYVSS